MSNKAKILRDLAAGQSTADSLAGRLDIPKSAVELICETLITENKITSHRLGDTTIQVYRLNNPLPIPHANP